MIYFCCDRLRRNKLVGAALNGIDYLEVLDHDAPTQAERQRKLLVHFINDLIGFSFNESNILIEGGERIRKITALRATAGTGGNTNILSVELDQYGDFSIYTLRLVQNLDNLEPPQKIDPLFAAIDFSFKVECPTDFDCQPACTCPPAERKEPEINYLAKDFGSFRRLMLDRMTLLVPGWRERNPADFGIAAVEALAYVGDHLSYQQDAIATEAYLGTARRRVSVRRHALLVDYPMHDGCNARVWVQLQVNNDVASVAAGTRLYTRIPGQPPLLPDDSSVLAQAQEAFETLEEVALFKEHNEMFFYTWSDQRCCLPEGATQATLKGSLPNLKAGEFLIFEEVRGPNTDKVDDANPAHRCAVRLTAVRCRDAVGQASVDPLTKQAITEISWAKEDALPFPLCISSQTDRDHGGKYIEDVSIARGNIVLADHGRRVPQEGLRSVPPPTLFLAPPTSCDHCEQQSPKPIPSRYRPLLAKRPLTFAVGYESRKIFEIVAAQQDEADLDQKVLPKSLQMSFETSGLPFQNGYLIQGQKPFWSISDGKSAYMIKDKQGKLNVYETPLAAKAVMKFDSKNALAALSLRSKLGMDERDWKPQRDLLLSKPDDRHFVVESEKDGRAWIRFGDNQCGLRPELGTTFTASYRIGNGTAGNVGAEAIAHIVTSDVKLGAALIGVRNPVPAKGGVEPESIENVRQYAPAAFRKQGRAVTENDYSEVTERHPGVQRAVATFRWTGSWHTVFITVDRLGGLPVDEEFERKIRMFVERFRLTGYDIEVNGPQFVSLEIAMIVCVERDYFRANVKEALLEIFSKRVLPDGRRGLFHPDEFTFGQTVYLSRFIAAAQAVAGVVSVQITKFQRRGVPDEKPLAAGKLELGRLEIARCDNDPNFAERGAFQLWVGGEK